MGSTFAKISWLFMSITFSTYLDGIANSTDTDGAPAAPIGFLVWLSMIVTTLVDEINGQLDITRQWIQQPGRQS